MEGYSSFNSIVAVAYSRDRTCRSQNFCSKCLPLRVGWSERQKKEKLVVNGNALPSGVHDLLW